MEIDCARCGYRRCRRTHHAVKAGSTVISAKPAVGYSVTSTINVKIVNEIIHITDINLTNEDLEVFVTSTLPLTWQTTPADPTYPG